MFKVTFSASFGGFLPVITLALTANTFMPTLSLAAPQGKSEFENEIFRVRATTRSTEQVTAFYEARGFPKTALQVLQSTCFVTISIKNKSSKILWHDLSRWEFSAGGKSIERIHRREWFEKWTAMSVSAGLQSTFRWTLLPETLDFRPGEGEGGNVTLKYKGAALEIQGEFQQGGKTGGKRSTFKISGLQCGEIKK